MKKYILLLFLIFGVYSSKACSCSIAPVFCPIIKHSVAIVQAVKIKAGSYIESTNFTQAYMEVKIVKVIQGKIIKDTLLIIGDNSPACQESVSQFKINDTMILALASTRDSNYLSICGRYYLNYRNGIVSGNLTSQHTTSMAYDSFLTFLKTAPCLTADIIEDQKIKNTITVSPNPGTGAFNLIVNQAVKNVEIKIYNIEGKIIFSDRISADANNLFPIDLINQPDGLYFIKLTGNSYEMNTKIVKN